jgi:hypothetical protein
MNQILLAMEFVEPIGRRNRFAMRAALQTVGLYERSLVRNRRLQTTFVVDNRLQPISPKAGLTTVSEGFAIVRYSVVIQTAAFLLTVVNPWNEKCDQYTENVETCKVPIASDYSRCEIAINVAFSEVGRWQLIVKFRDPDRLYAKVVAYWFNLVKPLLGRPRSPRRLRRDPRLVPVAKSGGRHRSATGSSA